MPAAGRTMAPRGDSANPAVSVDLNEKHRCYVITLQLRPWLQSAAERLGFDLCGIAPAEIDPQNRSAYLRWLERGFHGQMGYMRRFERLDLRTLLPSVRSVICLAINYNTGEPLSTTCQDTARGWIARYAWGDDYHNVLRRRMEQLVEELREQVGPGLEAKIYVDTGPLLERAMAWAAGLGWIAKNTCLINERLGSWLFLGEILTNLDLEPGLPPPDRCGSCTRCLEACPTGAIPEPYVLDATRCISYFTIEVKGDIPEPARSQLGHHAFGCDICQDVCPWNREAPLTPVLEFQPRRLAGQELDTGETTFHPQLLPLAELDEEAFHQQFRGSPLRRPKYRGFLRNVVLAMGNSGDPRFRPVLERLAQHSDPLIAEHAAWALQQLR
jgi:epoxyqueuosine reductase